MLRMNWKARLKNPIFWLTALSALIMFVYTLLGLFGEVPAIFQSTVMNVIAVVISALAALGVIIDPTTSGLSDSRRVLTYTTTYKSDPEGEYTDADE